MRATKIDLLVSPTEYQRVLERSATDWPDAATPKATADRRFTPVATSHGPRAVCLVNGRFVGAWPTA